ncbi:MAG TPA: hypothetical protein VEH84_12275 [Alphaproteobacteria bacterium]|nr:hypothetical protein [Alphaproteobacteria bacterium]
MADRDMHQHEAWSFDAEGSADEGVSRPATEAERRRDEAALRLAGSQEKPEPRRPRIPPLV